MTQLNLMSRFLFALNSNPELLNDFNRFGKVPRCFSSLDTQSLRDVRGAVEALENSRQNRGVLVADLVLDAGKDN